jgi:hypothetical protein
MSTVLPVNPFFTKPNVLENPTSSIDDKVNSAAAAAIAPLARQVSYTTKILNIALFPLHFTIDLVQRTRCLRDCFYPFQAVAYFIADLFYAAYYQIKNMFATPELGFSESEISEMKKNYWALGNNKLREGMEKCYYDKYGPLVFDRGLHRGTVEPGFKRSWERAAHFLSYQFNRKMDADLYLDIHSIVCSHFMGWVNGTLMGQDKVGVFRNTDDCVQREFAKSPNFNYPAMPETENELAALNLELQQRFGAQLSRFHHKVDGSQTLKFVTASREQVTAIFNFFSETLYHRIEHAQSQDEKLVAICDFNRKCEWLHTTRDGSARTNFLAMNFLLTQHGFHPVLLDYPSLGNIATLDEWVKYVRQGMKDWEAARDGKAVVTVEGANAYETFRKAYRLQHQPAKTTETASTTS